MDYYDLLGVSRQASDKDLKNARDQYSGDRLIKEATKACENWIEQAKLGDESERKGLIKALVCMLKQ